MHLLFGIVLIVLVVLLVRETIILIGLLFQLAWRLIALFFLLVWLPIAAGIDLHRYCARRRMLREIGLDAVTIALGEELTGRTLPE
jgi:hypothetical protein